jgi:hypothetical protein
METYRNENFQGKSFVLEEATFVRCTLTDCDLYYSGGDFEWIETRFDNCRFHWRGPAKNTLAMAQVLGMTGKQGPPQNLISATTQRPN